MGLGSFFRSFIGIIPLVRKLLKNPIVRAIIISKIGPKWIAAIEALIEIADLRASLVENTLKHNFVRAEFREVAPGVNISDAELDMHISALVAKKRRPGTVEVISE